MTRVSRLLAGTAVAVAVALGGAVAGADAPSPASTCPQAGCSSAVSIDAAGLRAAARHGARITLCIDAHCRRFRRASSFLMQVPQADGPGPVRVRFIVKDRRVHTIRRIDQTMRLHEVQPNGPDCPPVEPPPERAEAAYAGGPEAIP